MRPRFRRSIVLINKPFQFRFALYVCSWLFALSLIYPLIIYSLFDFFSGFLAADPMGPALADLKNAREELLLMLFGLQLLFLGVTFLISIFMSHRIAGPLYKLRKTFEQVKIGNLTGKLGFRKGDHFHDLADDYNVMINGLRNLVGRNHESVASAITKIEITLTRLPPEQRRELEEAVTTLRETYQRISV